MVSLHDLEELGIATEAHEPNGPQRTPGEQAEHQESLRHLGGAIERLPRRERIVLVLYHERHLTMKQIARVLGVTESRASQLHTAAMSKLARRLDRRRAA